MTKALEALESIKVTVSTATEANVIDGIDLFPRQIAELRIGIAEAEKQPVHASDMSEKHVHKSEKDRHEWFGLTHIEIGNLWADSQEVYSFAKVIEAKLKEKNT
jgi:hypothetical protein